MENPTKISSVVQTMMVMVGQIIPVMHFPMTPPSGMTLMGMEVISQMMKSLHAEIIKLVTTQTFSQVMEVNVKIRMGMDTATIMYQVEMHFHLMGLNGMIPTETDLEITHLGITVTFVPMIMPQM